MPGWDFGTTGRSPGPGIGLGESVDRGHTLASRSVDRIAAVALMSLLALVVVAPALAADSSESPDPSPSASPSPLLSESPSPLPSELPSPSPLPSESPSASPGGLVLDGVLGIIVLAGDGGSPIPGATVIVQASTGTGAAFAFQLRTDSDGNVTFTGLPRPADPETSLLWVISVKARVRVIDGECSTTTNYAGSNEVLAGSEPKAIPVFAQEVTSIQVCGANPGSGSGSGSGENAAPTNRPRTGGGGVGGAASARPALTPPATTTEPAPASHSEAPVAGLGLLLVAASIVLLTALARRRDPALTDPH
jgi:hypothetical protein